MNKNYSRVPAAPETNEDEESNTEGTGPEIAIPVDVLPESENWEDGQTYDISMTVKQTGPGKFEILEAEQEGTPADEAEDKSENDTDQD